MYVFSICSACLKTVPLGSWPICEILPCGGIANMGVIPVYSYPRSNGLAGTIVLNLITFTTTAIIPSP